MLLFATVAFGMPFILTLYAQQVLGYSAVKFGLTSVVFPAMAAVGSIVGQALVLRVGFRPVAAVGMALMGAGSLLLTQVSVDGSYFGDIFLGAARLRPRHRPRLRDRHGRRARRRRRARVRARLRSQQHGVPDRRRDRDGDRRHRRRLANRRLPRGQRAARARSSR